MYRRFGRAALFAGVAAGLAFAAGGASAQDATVQTAPVERPAPPLDPRDQEIAELREEVHELAAQVADLKSATSSGLKEVRASQSTLPQVSISNGRPTIATADGDNKFAIRSVVQFDAAHYDVSPLRTDNDLASGTNFRRARIGFDATVFKNWNIALWGDFGGSGGETPVLNQAFIEYAGFKPFGGTTQLRLRVGAWATPTGEEDATSNTDSLFLERAAIAELVRGIAGGDGRSGVGAFWSGDRWYVSGVLTGAVVGVPATAEFDEQEGYLARVAVNPIHGADYDVHLGANVTGVLKPADTTAGPLTAQAIRLRERPELRVDGTRLVDTGNIAADGLTAWGLEGGASFKSLLLQSEWFKINVDRQGVLFDPSFSGWYVQGAWALTGEHRAWSSANGGFRGIKPNHNFNPAKGGWGAFEVAARYSVLDLNDQSGLAGAAAPAGGIRGGRQEITTVGLNWYPNTVVRFLLDYQWANINRLNAAGASIGENVKTLSFRSQFAF